MTSSCSLLPLLVRTSSVCAFLLSAIVLTPAAFGADDTPAVRMNLGAVFSEDEEIVASLGESLAAFLGPALRGDVSGPAIAQEDVDRHGFFFDSLRSLGARLDTAEQRPMLLECYPIGGEDHLLTLAFLTTRDDVPQIYRIIELHAYPHDGGYRFTSPFEYRTRVLNTRTIGNVTFHFADTFDAQRAQELVDFKASFETLVDVPPAPLDYYGFATLDALLKAHGLVHDAAKCNWLEHDLGFFDGNGGVFITGADDERDVFEFVCGFLRHNGGDESDLYSPARIGMAAYYGGYALSRDDMPTLKAQFRARLAEDPDFNFLDEYNKARGSSINRHFTHYVINAFLCEEIIDKHGFDQALRLVRSGSEGERFYATVEDILGVDEAGFHALILRLIDADEA